MPIIESVDAHVLSIPPSSRQDAPWAWGFMAQVFIEMKTDDGLTGIGEAFGYGTPWATAAVVNRTLAPLLVGADATAIKSLTDLMFQKTHLFGRYGITTFAISGVEIALWDLAGKRADMPLFELLGGAASLDVHAYASLVRYPEEHPLIFDEAARAESEGYGMIKLHQSTSPSVAMGRRAIDADMPLTVDINCQWRPEEAIRSARAMNEYELLWLEEPVWPPEDFPGLSRVQSTSGVALASGENLCTVYPFQQMIEAGAVRYAQPSVTKVGGIAEFLKVARLCETQGVELAPHSPYFGPGFVATLHLIAHTGQARWIEKIYFDLEMDPFSEPLTFSDGVFTVPSGPGLGVELNEEMLRKYSLDFETSG